MAVLLSLLGTVLLLMAIISGLLVAFDLPAMVAAGLPDVHLNKELTRTFGFDDWPRLVHRLAGIIAAALAFAAAIALILARRRAGGMHMLRVILGISGLCVALGELQTALYQVNWRVVAGLLNGKQVGPAIEAFMDVVPRQPVIFAGVAALAALVILAWPARKYPVSTWPAGGQGASS